MTADFDPDLEWLLVQGPVVMRERGTTGGIIDSLERGGHSDGSRLGADGLYVHPFTDSQLGTGGVMFGDIERHRWLSQAWHAVSEESRNLLTLRHVAPRAAHRSDEGFGARDRFVAGSDGRSGAHGPRRTGVEAQLGEFGAVALAVYAAPQELLLACHAFMGDARNPDKSITGKQAAFGRIIRRAIRQAKTALEPAWDEWWLSKRGADPMRRSDHRISEAAPGLIPVLLPPRPEPEPSEAAE